MRITKIISGINLLLILAISFVALNAGSASALSGSEFVSGRIIDDAVFFNPNSMNSGDIQAFLNSKVTSCDTNGTQAHSSGQSRAAYGTSAGYPPPYTCLKDYVENVSAGRTPDAYCGGTVFAGVKSAAQIVNEVSQACGVSPKALIVLLQKEQSLITDDWPWSIQYRSATGYGCPDTAPCDAEYYGFFNQVYHAARQFQRYAKQPLSFNYRGGATSYVQYNPNAACGGGNVAMQNQATAGLYNYTPYQPNASALANLYGSGDSCGAYGNRNFWRMFNDWFGSPHSNTPYAWAYEGQWAYADASRTQQFTSTPTSASGGEIYVTFKARNMGTQTWSQSTMRVGTSHPQDRVSTMADPGWIGNNRPAALAESTVAPGQIGTFNFTLQTPNNPGTHSEYFNLLIEGQTWLNDLGLYFTVNVNNTASANATNRAILNSGETLNKHEYLLSPDSQTALVLQGDGNLVQYTNFKSPWNTGPFGTGVARLTLQEDGNLVIYNSSNQALWNTQTQGNPGARLVLQTDGNIVLYNAANSPLWATHGVHTPDNLSYVNTRMGVHGFLFPGQSLETADRRYKLIMQTDGNLVLYSPTRALWASGTNGTSIRYLAMQGDGNLVLYGSNSNPIWYSNTAGHGNNLQLVIQQDGNLVLYNPQGTPFWHTATAGQQ